MLILCIRASLALFSLKRIRQTLHSLAQQHPTPRRTSIANLTHAVQAVGRRTPGATCLVNGLAGHYLLSCNGYEPTLHIGVKKGDDNSLAAHAWVCIGQQVVIGAIDDLATYIPFPGLDEPL